jgi:hypothetical protein
MCEQIDVPVKKITPRRRRKLWEIGSGHHCSILGTCLRRADLQRFSKKKMFQVESGANDYQIHSALVGFAATRNPKSRVLHKFLEERYRAAVKRYAAIEDGHEVFELWKQDLKRGAVSGAYWAIMTNQSFSSETRTEIYGQNHMMSHDTVSGNQREQRMHEEIVNKAAMLEEMLLSERKLCLEKQKALDCERAALKKVQKKSMLLAADNKKISEKNAQLKSELAGTTLSAKIENLKEQLLESNKRNVELCAEIETLKRTLEDNHNLFDLASDTVEEVELQNALLEESVDMLQQEVFSMETAMLGRMDSSCNCSTCDDENTNRCPGPDLCGKTILYVGGLHKMITHYKQLVENHGGKFLHHDGGKEDSKTILPKMLNTADAVLCPVDCVSHDACSCVKKVCKRYQKPYVMMRSSGLSSLTRGLTEILQ